MTHLIEGTRVTWMSKGVQYSGLVVSYPDSRGCVFVAVDSEVGEPNPLTYHNAGMLTEEKN